MRAYRWLVWGQALAGLALGAAAAELKVVASTLDMADLARQVGGERVGVYAISDGKYDLHYFEPRPSQVLKLKQADLLIVGGLGVDVWINGLLDASRNDRIRYGAAGFVDPSEGVAARDVPGGRITGEMGDVHPHGNPHFWFTPENVIRAVDNITAGLIRVAPALESDFRRGRNDYVAEIESTFDQLKRELEPYRGVKVLQYHPSWDYFCATFGLEIAGSVEPKPGIPPSAAHLATVIDQIRRENVRLILAEPYYPERPLRFLREQTGVKVLRLPLYLGGDPARATYLDNLRGMVEAIRDALAEAGSE